MKIGVLTASLSRQAGGFFWSVRALSQGVLDAGCAVEVFAVEDALSADDRELWASLAVHLCPMMGPKAFGFAPSLAAALRDSGADIIHAHGSWMYPSIAIRLWARRNGNRYIISPRGMLDPWAMRHSRTKKRLAGWLYEDANLRNAACIHALNAAEANAIRAYGLHNPICIIPNGVNLPDEEGVGKAPPPWQSVLPDEARVVLYLGRLHPKKNLTTMIDAWAAALKQTESSNWLLVIAGWDQNGYEAKLKVQARTLNLDERVIFVGPLFGDRKESAFRHAAAFALPSLSEGLPMAVLEAWSYGLPVLMTDACNIPEGFQERAAVRLPLAKEEMASVLANFWEQDSQLLRKIGERGRHLVKRCFAWNRIASEMVEVYRWILNGGPKPDSVIGA